jgi:hypothetical protein
VTGLPTGVIYRIVVVPEPATFLLCLYCLLVMANLHARYYPWARVI